MFLATPSAPHHAAARDAVHRLADSGRPLATLPQILVEFWVVATRPAAVNGLGWEPNRAAAAIDAFLAWFVLLVETRDAYERWRDLVLDRGIRGKRAHDARIAAVMVTAGASDLLTFNTTDFDGLPGIVAVHP